MITILFIVGCINSELFRIKLAYGNVYLINDNNIIRRGLKHSSTVFEGMVEDFSDANKSKNEKPNGEKGGFQLKKNKNLEREVKIKLKKGQTEEKTNGRPKDEIESVRDIIKESVRDSGNNDMDKNGNYKVGNAKEGNNDNDENSKERNNDNDENAKKGDNDTDKEKGIKNDTVKDDMKVQNNLVSAENPPDVSKKGESMNESPETISQNISTVEAGKNGSTKIKGERKIKSDLNEDQVSGKHDSSSNDSDFIEPSAHDETPLVNNLTDISLDLLGKTPQKGNLKPLGGINGPISFLYGMLKMLGTSGKTLPGKIFFKIHEDQGINEQAKNERFLTISDKNLIAKPLKSRKYQSFKLKIISKDVFHLINKRECLEYDEINDVFIKNTCNDTNKYQLFKFEKVPKKTSVILFGTRGSFRSPNPLYKSGYNPVLHGFYGPRGIMSYPKALFV